MKNINIATLLKLFTANTKYQGSSVSDIRKLLLDRNNPLPNYQKMGEMFRLATGLIFGAFYAQSSTTAPAVKQSSSINYNVHNPLGLTVTPARTSAGLYTFAITGLPTELNPDGSANWDVKRVKVRAVSGTAARLVNYVSWAVSTTTLTVTIQISDNVASGATLAAADVVDFLLEVSYE